MTNNVFRKSLVLTIILMFIGMSISLSTGYRVAEKHVLTDNKLIETYAESSKVYDGDIEYWALLIGAWLYGDEPIMNKINSFCAESMYNSLLSSEHWQKDHIKIITCEKATKFNILKGFHWLDRMEDEDDVSIIYFATHGGQLTFFGKPLDFPPYDEKDHCDEYLMTYYSSKFPFLTDLRDDELNLLLDQLESQGICVIIDSCYAGGFNDTSRKNTFKSNIFTPRNNNEDFSSNAFINGFSEEIKKDGRVILMSSQEDELSWSTTAGYSYFTNTLIKSLGEGFGDYNNNSYISAEEAFNYTQFKIDLNEYLSQHPTIYDGYEGDLDLTVSRYILNFFDDCESVVGWKTIDHTGGIGGDLWHLSDIDCNSPTHCWYLGDENTLHYNNNMNNSLVSPEIKLGTNPILTFVIKTCFEDYDSLWLEISTDNWSSYYSENIKIWAYGAIWGNWELIDISLKSFSGKTIQIRFRVESDESIPFRLSQGVGYFIIDDIEIYSERGG